jgi:HK97 family phage prohead protease
MEEEITMENKIEYRNAAMAASENDNDACTVHGRAIVFDTPQTVFKDRFGNEYREVIDSHALDNAVMKDVPLRLDHDKSGVAILARTRNKSLTLTKKDDGLYIDAELRSNLGKDVYTAVKEGDIKDMSFGFVCNKDKFDPKTNTRTVLEIAKLTDVSIVQNGAYDAAYVEARNNENTPEWVEAQQKVVEAKQKLILLTYL